MVTPDLRCNTIRYVILNGYYSLHATALATFAETVGGLAALSTLNNDDRAILVNLNVEVKRNCNMIVTTPFHSIDTKGCLFSSTVRRPGVY